MSSNVKTWVVLKKDGDLRYVFEHLSSKEAAELKDTDYYEIIHWHSGIFNMGPPKKNDNVAWAWPESITPAQKRRAVYKLEMDEEFIQYRCRVVGDGDADAPIKNAWKAKRRAVKQKFLKDPRACTVDASTDVFTYTDHDLADDKLVSFQADAMPTGLTAGTQYYARDCTDNTWKVAATEGGAAIDFTTDGTNVTYQKEYVADS